MGENGTDEKLSPWIFSYEISKPVDYTHVFPQIHGIEIKTDVTKTQKSIISFSITIENEEYEEVARETAKKKAQKFANLLSLFSRTSLKHPVDNIGTTHGTVNGGPKNIGYDIHELLDRSISQKHWNKIWSSKDEDLEYAIERICGLLHTPDHVSIIRELNFLVCYLKEEKNKEFKEYKSLRNAISHDKLCEYTLKDLAKDFKKHPFKINNKRFDFQSDVNRILLKKHSDEFLKKVILLIKEKIKKL